MYTLISKENCSRCEIAKTILKNKNIEFENISYESLSPEDKKNYLNIARKDNNMEFPIIIKDNKSYKIQEID